MGNKLKTAIILIAFVLLVCTLFYAFMPRENKIFTPVTDFMAITLGMTAGISALITSKTFGWRKSKEGRVWIFLALGYLAWAIGEILWAFSDIILKTSPFPSGADIFYVGAYIPLFIGLWLEYRIIKNAVTKKDILKAFLFTFAIVIISAFLVLVPIAAASNFDMLSKGLSLFYPIADLFILFPTLIFFFVFKKEKSPSYWLMSKSWLIITIAIALWTAADLLFAYLDWNEIYKGIPLMLTELAWLCNYLLFSLGAYYHRLIARGKI